MKPFRFLYLVIAAVLPAQVSLSAADEKSTSKPRRPPAERAAEVPKTPLGEPQGTREPLGEPPATRTAPARGARSADPTGELIDLNTADHAVLASHPLIGPMVAKAIIAARPFSSLDDLNRIEGISAERLEQLRLVTANPAAPGESPAPDRIGPDHARVDVNTADRATLEKLSSVGPDLAEAIIAARPFKRIDDLDRIQGISAERLEHMRAELTVGAPELATRKDGRGGPRRSEVDRERARKDRPSGR